MSKVAITAEISAATAAKLERLAKAFGYTPDAMVARAIKRYVDEGTVYLDGLDEADASIDRGEGIPHNEVVRYFAEKMKARNAA